MLLGQGTLSTFCRNGEEIGVAVVKKNEFKAAEGMSAIRRKYASNLVFLLVKREYKMEDIPCSSKVADQATQYAHAEKRWTKDLRSLPPFTHELLQRHWHVPRTDELDEPVLYEDITFEKASYKKDASGRKHSTEKRQMTDYNPIPHFARQTSQSKIKEFANELEQEGRAEYLQQ
ncbi:Hypothetical predicted protein, partial [Paramuricea clavata]